MFNLHFVRNCCFYFLHNRLAGSRLPRAAVLATDALVAMFALNRVDGDSNSGQSAWKVLIYDDFCRDIISPLLNIGQLRENGITLHL